MEKMCRFSLRVMLVVLACALAFPLAASAEMVKKVDNFIIFLDQSGSMAQAKAVPGNQKLDQAIEAVGRFDQAVPALGYTSSVATFASYKVISAPAPYQKGAVGAAAAGFAPPFNHMTAMGEGLARLDEVISQLSGRTAVVMFTDGEWNEGISPVAEAQKLYGKYGANLCIHVVSYAGAPEAYAGATDGRQVIDQIRALSGCSVAADASSLASEAGMAQFVKAVLYDEVQPAPKPAPAPVAVPAPAPAPAPVAKEVVTFNLQFGFDKADITDEMVPVLEQAKMILEEDRTINFDLSGHTCSIGPEAYNQGLSERRAASVKNWLVSNGIAASRLDTVGYGEARPKYDNNTREGRSLNRRVELQSK